jgi:hypothetical protein
MATVEHGFRVVGEEVLAVNLRRAQEKEFRDMTPDDLRRVYEISCDLFGEKRTKNFFKDNGLKVAK